MRKNNVPDLTIDQNNFNKIVKTFYNNCLGNGRYKSWEHCKNFFDNFAGTFYKNISSKKDQNFNNTETIEQSIDKDQLDLLCLHLAFYLASWGMYRGSAFILQYDFTVHKKAILTLLKSKYEKLWIINIDKDSENNFFKNADTSSLLFDLIAELKECYKENDENNEDNEPTDTLLTKILMGTMGCIPAFDRYFIAGLTKHYKEQTNKNKAPRRSGSLNKDIFEKLYELCQNVNLFINCDYQYYNKTYPKMKLLDMYFWELGFEKDVEDWLEGEGEYKTKSQSVNKMLNSKQKRTVVNAKQKLESYKRYFENNNDKLTEKILQKLTEVKKILQQYDTTKKGN